MITPFGDLSEGSHTFKFDSHNVVVDVSKAGFTETIIWNEGYEPITTLSPESRIQELEAELLSAKEQLAVLASKTVALETKTAEHEVILKG